MNQTLTPLLLIHIHESNQQLVVYPLLVPKTTCLEQQVLLTTTYPKHHLLVCQSSNSPLCYVRFITQLVHPCVLQVIDLHFFSRYSSQKVYLLVDQLFSLRQKFSFEDKVPRPFPSRLLPIEKRT